MARILDSNTTNPEKIPSFDFRNTRNCACQSFHSSCICFRDIKKYYVSCKKTTSSNFHILSYKL